MKHTCHSEYLKLASVYIKTVTEAFVDEDKLKGEWKELNYLSKPDLLASKLNTSLLKIF